MTGEKVKNAHEFFRGNCILMLFNLFCCSKHNLSMILLVSVTNLARWPLWRGSTAEKTIKSSYFGARYNDTVYKYHNNV